MMPKLKPEPKNKLSAEWRHWKLQQMESAFQSDDDQIYNQAWSEFRSLLGDLILDRNFWHISNALALLPQMLTIRQRIDQMILQDKRSQAGMKGAQKRRESRARHE